MSLCVTCNETQPRSVLSNATTTVVAVITAMTFSASGAAPTPLYHQYQESFGLTPFAITIIFAAYVLSLLAALLTVGSLSDYIGRRPAILAALVLNVVSMAMFMTAELRGGADRRPRAAGLCHRACDRVARRRDPRQRPQPRPDPQQHHGVLRPDRRQPRRRQFWSLTRPIRASSFMSCFWSCPLSRPSSSGSCRKPRKLRAGAIASLRPHVNVPAQASRAMVRVTPVTIASWALGGFYFSLMPALVRVATGVTLPVVGGLVVSALTLSGAISVLCAAVRVAAPDAERRHRCAGRRRRDHARRSARATRVADAGRHGRSQVSVLAQPSPAPCGPCCLSRRQTNVPSFWRRSTS